MMKQRKQTRKVNPQVRLYAVCAIFLVFCAVLAARLIYYQLVENDRYASAVIGGNVRTEKVLARLTTIVSILFVISVVVMYIVVS